MFDLIFAFEEQNLQHGLDLNDFESQNLHMSIIPYTCFLCNIA